MRRKKVKWLLLSAALLVISAGALVLPAWKYAQGDSVTRAGMDTRRLLSDYERTGNPAPLRVWLTNGPSEAPGEQMRITLAQWSLSHQAAFLHLVEGLEPKRQADFADWFAFTLMDSGLDKSFQDAFRGRPSKMLDAIRSHLPQNSPVRPSG